MKKILILFLFITSLASGQDVIDFKLLYEKKIKNTANYNVSDNTLDFKSIDHQGTYYVKFIGEYPKRLVIKNLIGGDIILEGSIKTATDNKTFQVMDSKRVNIELGTIIGTGSGGTCGQLVYLSGKWQNVTIKGGKLNQSGNAGGAAMQFESYSDPAFNHGTLIIDGLVVTGAMGEGIYVLYNQPIKAYLDTLIIRNTNISNTRRDFWQHANVRYALYENNIGDNGALEKNTDHMSGFSLNDGNKLTKLIGNKVSNVPQFIYSGTINGTLETSNNIYIQGTSAIIANQSIYTKTSTLLQYDSIIAPKVKIAAIAQDKAVVTYQGLTVQAPKLFRYTTPAPIEIPAVKSYPVQAIVEETTINGKTTKYLIYLDQRFLLN